MSHPMLTSVGEIGAPNFSGKMIFNYFLFYKECSFFIVKIVSWIWLLIVKSSKIWQIFLIFLFSFVNWMVIHDSVPVLI